MEYTIKGLCDAFAKMIPIAKGPGELVYVMNHSISADSNQITHEFQLSDGGMITLTTTTKEEQPTMKPAEIIKQEKQVLEQAIRDACKKFVDTTGVEVMAINIRFIDTTPIGGGYETQMGKIEVEYTV